MARWLVAALALILLFPGLGLFAGASSTPLAASILPLGVATFEPTLGVSTDGTIYYSTTPVSGVAIGFGTGVHKSTDGGATWKDISPRVAGIRMAPETNDPYVYVDPATGRVFQFAMAPALVCSVLSWSDDGGSSWTTNPRGCASPPPWDHQTLVAAKPRAGLVTVGYPNVLVQCVNHLAGGSCGRSLDGGLTWTQAGVYAAASCSGLSGHLAAAPDGTLYLPRDGCGQPRLHVSRDGGTTWAAQVVSYSVGHTTGPDPAATVDSTGRVYYTWIDTAGRVVLASSANLGNTWMAPVVVSPPGVTANLPTIAAAGPGKVAIAYTGSENLPNGYGSTKAQIDAATWNAYVTVSGNADAASPVWETARANPLSDPLVRGPCGPGRCPGMVDFIDVVISPDGRALAAFVDSCSGACVTGTKNAGGDKAILVKTSGGPALV